MIVISFVVILGHIGELFLDVLAKPFRSD